MRWLWITREKRVVFLSRSVFWPSDFWETHKTRRYDLCVSYNFSEAFDRFHVILIRNHYGSIINVYWTYRVSGDMMIIQSAPYTKHWETYLEGVRMKEKLDKLISRAFAKPLYCAAVILLGLPTMLASFLGFLVARGREEEE